MPTKIERLEASLKKAHEKADLKRLKKAEEYFTLALKTLEDDFHNEDYSQLANGFFAVIHDQIDELRNIVKPVA